MIWLIEYTHYQKRIDPELMRIRSDYMKIKRYKRDRLIGNCAPVGDRVYSIGLLRIATILHRNGFDVKYYDFETINSLLDDGFTAFPDVVAFSCVCPTVPLCADMAKRIKSVSPKTMLLLGGIHVNLCPDETRIRFPIFDDLCIGYELDAAEKICGRKLHQVDDIYADYSLLPFPLTDYSINTFTTSGCPFRCGYCSDGRAPLFKSSENGQLNLLKELLPQRTMVHFFDSVLGYSTEGARAVCKAIKATEHNFILSCDMRADLLTKELILDLEDAGFSEIRMGIESGDQELLDRNNRTLKVEGFMEKLQMVRDHSSMYIALYSVVGLPGTTDRSVDMTLDYFDGILNQGYADEIKNTQYVPYPIQGVDHEKRGIHILTTDWSKYDRQSFPVYRTNELHAEKLWELYLKTARSINSSWLRSCGFRSYDEIPFVDTQYEEYMENTYMLKEKRK